MESTTFTAKGTSDLLGTVPALFGFHPENSLIAIATYGPRNRFGFRLRLDMPNASHVNEAAEVVTRHLIGQNAEGVVLIALTDRKDEAGALVSRITELLGEIPVHEAVRADRTYYWSYLAEAVAQGTLYADPAIAPVVVEAIGAGMPIYASRAELEARYNTVPEVLLEQVRDALNTASGEVGGPETADHARVSVRVLRELDTATDGVDTLSAESIAWLVIGASMTQIRDDMWSQMTRDNAQTHAEVWRVVANHLTDEASVAPYTLSAFANWLQGDGTQALIAVDRALNIAPEYAMAGLVQSMIENGIGPKNWDGFDPTGTV